jgi:pSer/pThr/pTyr-binding forkhead associated (FHA) protein
VALTVVIKAKDPARDVALDFDATRIVIGRGKGCDLWLPDASVAKRHASIRREGGKTLIVDEGSANGIVVDRVKLPAHAPRALEPGSRVRVGRYWLEIRTGGGIASSPDEVRRAGLMLLRRQLAEDGEPSVAVLEVVGATGATGERIALEDDTREYVLGRGRDTDLAVADEHASRRHASVTARGEVWVLRDLGSKRGTYLRAGQVDEGTPEETRLEAEPRPWRDGELVRIGSTLLRLVDPIGQTLDELAAAPERKLRADEEREPPPGSSKEAPTIEAPEDPLPVGTRDRSSFELDAPTIDDADPVEAGRALATLDTMVALVALGLLGLSVAGLFWLLR